MDHKLSIGWDGWMDVYTEAVIELLLQLARGVSRWNNSESMRREDDDGGNRG